MKKYKRTEKQIRATAYSYSKNTCSCCIALINAAQKSLKKVGFDDKHTELKLNGVKKQLTEVGEFIKKSYWQGSK